MSEQGEKKTSEKAEKPAASSVEYPINQKLLEEATKAKEEWRVIRDRLIKIEEHKEKVSSAVHDRVRTDYKARMKIATDAVLKQKKAVDAEVTTLQEVRNKVSEELKQHQQSLEEIKFRNTLGEFSEEEFQSASREEEEKIGKFEAVLTAVNSNVHRYEAIFEDEPDLFVTQQEAPPEEEEMEVEEEIADISQISPISEVMPAPHEAEPITDASGYVIEEEGPGYFSPEEGDVTDHHIEESGTLEGTPSLEDIAESPSSLQRARIVIISGDDAGAAYPIKGTISFGRAESNTVTIRDAKISRQHAQIQQHGDEYVIVDLNSSNGTYVNQERIEEHVLSNGDEIRIGDCVIQFQT